jgi:hypothetical protein
LWNFRRANGPAVSRWSRRWKNCEIRHQAIEQNRQESIIKLLTEFNHQTETGSIMKRSYWSFAIVFLFLAALALPAPTVRAHETDNKPIILSASQSDKQKHDKACRARYRDCLSKSQIPAFECQYIYQDCLKNMI